MNNRKIALITGSSRGIGRELALHLASQGFNIIVNYHNNISEANKVMKMLSSFPVKAICIKADVGDPSAVTFLRKSVEEEFGRIDLLINNAGIIKRPGAWNEISNEDILTTVKTNLLGPIYVIKEFVPLLEKSDTRNIINITSTYAYNGAAAVLTYTSSKAGVISLTKAMALELSKLSIRVNAIALGNFDTEMTLSGGKELKEWIIATTPLKRLGNPNEVNSCIDFLLNNNFITGHILNVDGGQLLAI